jgi:hypothetical protein
MTLRQPCLGLRASSFSAQSSTWKITPPRGFEQKHLNGVKPSPFGTAHNEAREQERNRLSRLKVSSVAPEMRQDALERRACAKRTIKPLSRLSTRLRRRRG